MPGRLCSKLTELASLCTDLPGGQNVVLYSPRRLGKSSLIRVALNEIVGKGAVCAYVNLMALGSAQEMVEAVARAVTNAMVCSLGGMAKAFQKLTSTFRRVGVQFGIDPVTSGPVYSFTLGLKRSPWLIPLIAFFSQ